MLRLIILRSSALLLAIILVAAPGFARAESLFLRGWGVRGGVSSDPDQVFFGGHIDLAEIASQMRIQPNVEIGLGNDVTIVALNGDALWMFRDVSPKLVPYVGGELGLIYSNFDLPSGSPFVNFDDTDTNVGLSLVGGVEVGVAGGKRLFGELKLGVSDAPDVKFLGGLTF